MALLVKGTSWWEMWNVYLPYTSQDKACAGWPVRPCSAWVCSWSSPHVDPEVHAGRPCMRLAWSRLSPICRRFRSVRSTCLRMECVQRSRSRLGSLHRHLVYLLDCWRSLHKVVKSSGIWSSWNIIQFNDFTPHFLVRCAHFDKRNDPDGTNMLVFPMNKPDISNRVTLEIYGQVYMFAEVSWTFITNLNGVHVTYDA